MRQGVALGLLERIIHCVSESVMNDCPHFRISKPFLIALAGIVWCIAGFNVTRIGVSALSSSTLPAPWICLMPVVVFAAFGAMFTKSAGKHVNRIRSNPAKARPFWHFFDARAPLIMAIMMTAGFGLRGAGVLPDTFVSFFYTGLGAALACAGGFFLVKSLTYRRS